ncbi:MAG: helix-turn-helix domain-containing protein [Micropruina sp.]|uniref:TetR/AcrR family transcriptional regulator n=1 Tax=Micropruina sp. TaxID=2737536 RepID=UPI0039E658AB
MKNDETTEEPTAPIGLRERKKSDRRRRILAAAARLFAERGYDSVTTAEIARAADVGVGTLFRYAGSKAELLVSVMNDRVSEGIAEGLARARGGEDLERSILAILRPLARESFDHPENMLAYEREALFGVPAHREAASARVSEIEGAILDVLRTHRARPRSASVGLEDIAHTIYATLYVDIVRVGVGHAPLADLPDQVRRSVHMLVGALLEDQAASTDGRP